MLRKKELIKDNARQLKVIGEKNELIIALDKKYTAQIEKLTKECDEKVKQIKSELTYEKAKTAHYLEEIGALQDKVDELKRYNTIMFETTNILNDEINLYKEQLIELLGLEIK